MTKVIVFRGKAGVGKTTLSNAVAQRLNISIIRKDDIYDAIVPYIGNHQIRNEVCYAVLYKIIDTNILNGIDVIVDAGLHNFEEVLQFKSWVHDKKAVFVSFLCICSDEDLWAKRFNRRSGNPKPNNLITDFETLRHHYKDLKTEVLADETILDAVESIDKLVEVAISKLNSY